MEFTTLQGVRLPKIGLGTWQLRGKHCIQTVKNALQLGYRHLDTAQMYRNEKEVGRAIDDSKTPREEIFLTTKILWTHLGYQQVLSSVHESLKALQSSYINLLLIHAPDNNTLISETIRAMNELQDDGVARHIGVSNFSPAQTADAERASATPILTNQVEFNPLHYPESVHQYCTSHNLFLTAYSPLVKGRVPDNGMIRKIAQHHEKSAAQVVLRWEIQHSHVISIPKASNRSHLRENLEVFDFELSEEEMKDIA